MYLYIIIIIINNMNKSTISIMSKTSSNFRYKLNQDKNKPRLLTITTNNPKPPREDMFLTLQENCEKNSTSKSFTHHNYLALQTDQTEVMKLSLWDKENIGSNKESDKNLYQTLSYFYRKENKPQILRDLDKYNTLLEKKSKFNTFIEEATLNTNNKILLDFVNRGKKEQGSILYNSISKTKSRFDFYLFNEKNQKDFQADLNIDSSTLNTLKTENMNNDYYRKVIREKMQQETTTRAEIMDISKKVFEKKRESMSYEEQLTLIYDKRNKEINEFNEKKNRIKKEILIFQQDFEEEQKTMKKMNKLDQLVKINKAAAHNNNLEYKITQLNNELQKKIEVFNIQKEKILKQISIAQKEEHFYKKVLNELIRDQRRYYLDILKQGYDVRSEGLVWVLRNLLEMGTHLEYHHFPKFLTNQHCDYLIEMADICLEETQLKIVLKAVKNKQRRIKNEENMEKFNKIVDYAEKEDSKVKPMKQYDFYPKKKTIKDRLFNIFNHIYEKHEEAFKFTTEKRNEEIKLEKVQSRIRESLLERGANEKGDNYQALNNVLAFIEKNQNTKEYLEIILNIRARLNYLMKLKEELKKEQINLFKLHQGSNKRFTSAKSSLQYDLIFSALFGCNIQV